VTFIFHDHCKKIEIVVFVILDIFMGFLQSWVVVIWLSSGLKLWLLKIEFRRLSDPWFETQYVKLLLFGSLGLKIEIIGSDCKFSYRNDDRCVF